MMNGNVEFDIKRNLDINEFRAFTIIDDYVPLIFINSNDSHSGRLYSLLHELAHVAIGVNSLFNRDMNSEFQSYNDVERRCNDIAMEILVPIEIFKLLWDKDKNIDKLKKISKLAKQFKVSELVISRRAFEKQYILSHEYMNLNNILHSSLKSIKKHSVSVCNYDNFLTYFDMNCLDIINQCVETGYMLYTDAYRLTGLNRISFDKMMLKFEEQLKQID
jgi:Zn-dependent peptidase ImmA (M78 family)